MVYKTCKICRKRFEVDNYRKDTAKFCSSKCFGLWMSKVHKKHPKIYNQIQIKCLECGKTFSTYGCRAGRTKYCSLKCYNKSQIGIKVGKNSPSWKGGKVKYFCKFCGKEYFAYEERKRKYCSRKCSDLSHIGKHSSNWKGGKPKCKICNKEIAYTSTYCLNHKHLLWKKKHWKAAWKGSRKKLGGKMPKNMQRPGTWMNIKRGWFNINGKRMFFRSTWEANYALYLDFLIKQKQVKKWEYEKDLFVFEKIKFGTRSYRPDFKITNNNNTIEYHEVKGWNTARSKTQFNRMSKYYPSTKIIIIKRKQYNSIKSKLGKVLNFI